MCYWKCPEVYEYLQSNEQPDVINVKLAYFSENMIQYKYGKYLKKRKNWYHHLGSGRIYSSWQDELVVCGLSGSDFNFGWNFSLVTVVEFFASSGSERGSIADLRNASATYIALFPKQ